MQDNMLVKCIVQSEEAIYIYTHTYIHLYIHLQRFLKSTWDATNLCQAHLVLRRRANNKVQVSKSDKGTKQVPDRNTENKSEALTF